MTTVPPAKSTARPLVSIACTTARFGVGAVVERLAVARADEQRVVDADADADHRGDLRRERRNVEHAREQVHDRESDPDAEQRGHDRQTHREQRPERDQQDDDGREDADELARGHRLLGEHAAREFDAQQVGVGVLRDRAHVRREIERHVVRLHVEEDLGVGDLAVLRDEARAGRVVRARDADDVRLLAQLVEDRLDLARGLRGPARCRRPAPRTRGCRCRRVRENCCSSTSNARCDSVPGSENVLSRSPPTVCPSTLTPTSATIQATTTMRRRR